MERDEIDFILQSNYIENETTLGAFNDACIAWQWSINENSMSEYLIKSIHSRLMRNLNPDIAGKYRNVMVYVGGQPVLNAIKIPDALEHLVDNISDLIKNGQKETKIFLERTVKDHHVEFEKIHPFVDGNGRTGRILMNWERIKLNLPIHIIREGKEQQEYYKWFK